MREVYQNEGNENVVGYALEEMVREGGRRMLSAVLGEEMCAFLRGER